MAFPDGHKFFKGRYTVIRSLGSGNFSSVYLVNDEQFNKHYALKHLVKSENVKTWIKYPSMTFYGEAVKMASVSHPHLPKIIKHLEEEEQNFILMEYVKGKNLLSYLYEKEKQGQGKYLLIREVLEVGIQLADVLSCMHDHEPPLIFRDLKPDNIIRASRGKVYLIDFGISRFYKGYSEMDTIILGNPKFLAPEIYNQIESDTRADIYSLGATLYYLIAGDIPKPLRFPPLNFHGEKDPPGLEALIRKMVKPNREERPQNMYSVLHDLKEIQREHLGLPKVPHISHVKF